MFESVRRGKESGAQPDRGVIGEGHKIKTIEEYRQTGIDSLVPGRGAEVKELAAQRSSDKGPRHGGVE